jgi:hypothetical protein
MTHPPERSRSLNGLTTPGPTGLSHGFMHQHAKEWLAAPACRPTRFTESEADHHNHTADDAGEQGMRRPRDGPSTAFVLALPRALRVDPPRARCCPRTADTDPNTLRPRR